MTSNRITNTFKIFGLKAKAKESSNIFEISGTVNENPISGHRIYLPVLKKNGGKEGLYYNRTTIPNTVYSVVPEEIHTGQAISVPKVRALMIRKHLKIADLVDNQFVKPMYGSWVAKMNLNFTTPMYFKTSDLIEIELLRGLYLDTQRMNRSGWRGFAATNGIIVAMLDFGATSTWEYPVLKFDNDAAMVKMLKEDSYQNDYVDYASIPSGGKLSYTFKAGVRCTRFGTLTKPTAPYSKILSVIPMRNLINQRRMVVQNTMRNALKLKRKEIPLLVEHYTKVIPEVYDNPVDGINAVTYRDSSIPDDTFIASKSFAKKMFSYEKKVMTFYIPKNADWTMLVPIVTEDEIRSAINLGIEIKAVNKGQKILSINMPKIGSSAQIIQDLQNNKLVTLTNNSEVSTIRTKYPITVVSAMEHMGYAKREVKVIELTVYVTYGLKVGSKLIDRFSNKGTVSEIREDSEMPLVHGINESGNPYRINADLIYNPPVYKRKVGIGYRIEELLSMYAKINEHDSIEYSNPGVNARDMIAQLRDEFPFNKAYNIVYNGKAAKSSRIGVHYMYHLDNDPDLKFSAKGPSITHIDRIYLKPRIPRLFKNPVSELAKDIANSLGYNIIEDVTNDIITTQRRDKPFIPTEDKVILISKKLPSELITENISMVDQSALEGTVIDPRLETNFGRVVLDVGTILIPPALRRTMMNDDGGLIITDNLTALNAAISEQAGIEYYRRTADSFKIGVAIKKQEQLIIRFTEHMTQLMSNEIRHAYYPRVPGIHTVAVANDKLAIDVVSIPDRIYRFLGKGSNIYTNKYVLMRRHPIHRKYNMMVMKVIPNSTRSVIGLNAKTMAIADGDFDGDMVDIIFLTESEALSNMNRFSPSLFLKTRKDIRFKKQTFRVKATPALLMSQHNLKMYTSFSGAMANRLLDIAKTQLDHRQYNIMIKPISEFYHFTAQTALNLKHQSAKVLTENIATLMRISTQVEHGKLNDTYDYTTQVYSCIKSFGFDATKYQLNTMVKLFLMPSNGVLSHTSKNNIPSRVRMNNDGYYAFANK